MMCNTCGCRNAEEFDDEEMTCDELLNHIGELAYEEVYDAQRGNDILLAISETTINKRPYYITEDGEVSSESPYDAEEEEEFDSEYGGRGSSYAKKAKRMAYQRMGMLPKPKSEATFRRNIEYPSWFRNTQLAVVGMLSFALAYNGFKKE